MMPSSSSNALSASSRSTLLTTVGIFHYGEEASLNIGDPKYGGDPMLGIRVEIFRNADGSVPGWVECRLIDALGHEHVFVEKVPVVTTAHLDAGSDFPQVGIIACIVLGSSERDDGRHVVHIDTQTPWGIESTAGRSRFDVLAEQLREVYSDQ
jgi:hypothetical protein